MLEIGILRYRWREGRQESGVVSRRDGERECERRTIQVSSRGGNREHES